MAAELVAGYSVLARHYDALMGGVPYFRWVEFISTYALKLNRPVRIVDAGCGTGTVALALVQRGFQVTGIDLSEQMLTMARQKADELQVPVTWLHNSFQAVKMPCDMVISTCDGINHLLSTRQLVLFFGVAFSSLEPGGYLIFDINSEYKYRQILADKTFYWRISGLDVVWVNEFSPPYNRAGIILYEQSACGIYIRSTLEIIERCFKTSSLLYYLRRSGFRHIDLWNNYKSRLKSAKARRITIVAQK